MPHMFSRSLPTYMADMLPAIALIWAALYLAVIWFAEPSQASLIMIYISLGITVIYILFPFGALIPDKEGESLENSVQYRDVALTFSTDYDRENPMTTHSGLLRLLDLHIFEL